MLASNELPIKQINFQVSEQFEFIIENKEELEPPLLNTYKCMNLWVNNNNTTFIFKISYFIDWET